MLLYGPTMRPSFPAGAGTEQSSNARSWCRSGVVAQLESGHKFLGGLVALLRPKQSAVPADHWPFTRRLQTAVHCTFVLFGTLSHSHPRTLPEAVEAVMSAFLVAVSYFSLAIRVASAHAVFTDAPWAWTDSVCSA